MRRGKTTEPGLGINENYACKGNENGCTKGWGIEQGARSGEQRAESKGQEAKENKLAEQWSVRS